MSIVTHKSSETDREYTHMFNLSDGVKKALILIPTQPLPANTRVALRRKYLAELELAKAHSANFLIIGHPKSGNTWLKVMISRLYQFESLSEFFTALVTFNIGVELGQLLALMFILLVINYWRQFASFNKFAKTTNTALMSAGFMLVGMQLTGYFIS